MSTLVVEAGSCQALLVAKLLLFNVPQPTTESKPKTLPAWLAWILIGALTAALIVGVLSLAQSDATPEAIGAAAASVLVLGALAKAAEAASDLPESVRARLTAVSAAATLIGSALGLLGVTGALTALTAT
ncbi:hypothetical protein [Microbacterium sp. NPDC077184]|uniref:hypothetical protein n=1 Tax=Microbacterium sp. NPDC077184 TaxID=3154764 RepID=UPI0034143AAA